jgi:peptidyl-prolyl cis-trans isomerase C
MKYFVTAVLSGGLLCGQTQPVQVTPGTPAVKAPPPAVPSAPVAQDTVVAEVGGKKLTAADVDKLIASLPPQFQQSARAQPQAVPQMISQLFLYKRLAEDAEKAGLDKKTPYQEQLEFGRMQLLAQAQLTTYGNSISVTPEDQEKYYKDNPDKFKQAKVRVIYIAFNPTPEKPLPDGKKLPSEAEAKAKIDDLRKQILAGADFGKLAREQSDDKTSAAKDGDFGIIKHGSPYPDPVKNAVFALKPGGVSEAVKQPNGFYLIRLDELAAQPYDEVNGQINQEIRQQRFNEWTKALQAQYQVKVENPAYFSPKTPAQLQQVR